MMIAEVKAAIESSTINVDNRLIFILHYLIYIRMKQIQIKLNVKIHKVSLTVKFPCHIMATLKTGKSRLS